MTGLKVWNGSAFADGKPWVWNGSAFVQPTKAYVWNGSSFVQVWSNIVPIVFSEIGAGNAAAVGFGSSLSWSHSVAAHPNTVGFILTSDTGSTVSGATWNGAAATLVQQGGYSNTAWCHKVNSPTSGTVTANCGVGSSIAGNSVTYYNVNTVGTPITTTGTGTTASITFPGTAGQTWFVFMDSNGPNSANSYTASSGSGGTWVARYNKTGVSGVNLPLLFGDLTVATPGTCSVSVTLASSVAWGMVAIPLS